MPNGEIFRLSGVIDVDTASAHKAIDDATSKAAKAAKALDMKGKATVDGRNAEKALADVAKESRKASEEVKDDWKEVNGSITGQAGGIKSALHDAFSFTGGQLIFDFIKKSWGDVERIAQESMGLASDLNEVQNVLDVTFGANAAGVDRWAAAAKNAFGVSELKAKKFTGTMGAMLKSMGLAGDEVADMSESLVGLTGDLSSFYNLEHEEAFNKIRTGISGETEPLILAA